MWYFSWILGVGLAVGFGILNGMWHEFHLPPEEAGGEEGADAKGAQPALAGGHRR